MSTLLHFVRVDVRHFSSLIVTWVVLTIWSSVMVASSHRALTTGSGRGLVLLGSLLEWLASTALMATLVVRIVQLHPPVGTTAWWLTRPLRPGTLLGSRLLLIGLLLVSLPALCDAVLMAFYRVPAGQIARVVLEWVLVRAAVMVLLMAAAAMTRDFARFTILVGAGLVTAAAVINVAFLVMLSDSSANLLLVSSEFAAAVISRQPDPTARVAAWLVILSAGSLLLRMQYVRRSTHHAASIGAAGVVVAVVVALAWPWPLLHAEPTPPAWFAGDSLRLAAPPQTIYFDGGLIGDKETRRRTAHARAYLDGVPDGWIAMVRMTYGALELEDGRLTDDRGGHSVALRASDSKRAPVTRALQHALNVEEIGGGSSLNTTLPILGTPARNLPGSTMAATFRGDFDIDMMELQVAAVLPLAAGAIFAEGSYRLVVVDVLEREGGPELRVHRSRATSAFDRSPQPEYSFYLRNRRTREALSGQLLGGQSITRFPEQVVFGRYGYLATPYGFFVEPGEIRFPTAMNASLPSAFVNPRDDPQTNSAWLGDAELVVIRTIDRGRVKRSLEITGLMISP